MNYIVHKDIRGLLVRKYINTFDKSFLTNIILVDNDTMNKASKLGYINIIIYLRLHNCPWDKGTCKYAA